MMINIFTDPHLNVSRQAHTTGDSSKRLNQRLFQKAMECKHPIHQNFIAGDLFDKAFNPEWAVIQGMQVAEGCEVLAGNHDETNREGTMCSLQVVEEAGNCKVIRNKKVSGVYWEVGKSGVYLVPHHSSQELFVKALMEAKEDAEDVENPTLMVHCNRGEIMGPSPDSILVISKELEEELLTTFKRIFYGHEHDSHTNKAEGKVVTNRAVVLGNTHPTSFSDISDKYRYEYCTETDQLTRVKVWDKSQHYLKLEIGQPIPEDSQLEFIEVVGLSSRQEAMNYVSKVWEVNPQAFMVRSNVQYAEETVLEVTVDEPMNLAEAISKDLEDTNMKDLFSELLKEVNHGTN